MFKLYQEVKKKRNKKSGVIVGIIQTLEENMLYAVEYTTNLKVKLCTEAQLEAVN